MHPGLFYAIEYVYGKNDDFRNIFLSAFFVLVRVRPKLRPRF